MKSDLINILQEQEMLKGAYQFEEVFSSVSNLSWIEHSVFWRFSEAPLRLIVSYQANEKGVGENLEVSDVGFLDEIKKRIKTGSIFNRGGLSHFDREIANKFSITSGLIFPVFKEKNVEGLWVIGNRSKAILSGDALELLDKHLSTQFELIELAQNNRFLLSRLKRNALIAHETETLGVVGGWSFDLKTEEMFWTQETYKIYGLPHSTQVSPEIGLSYYSPESQIVISEAYSNLLEHGEAYALELPFVDFKGNRKWIKTTGSLYTENGEALFVYGAFEDVTYQKNLQLRNDSDIINHKVILDSVNDCIVTISEKGLILSTSKSVEKIFGYQQDELSGKNVSVLMPEPYASMHDKYMNQYYETGNAKIIGIGRELPALRKGGEEFPMELSISEAIDGNKRVFIGIVKDISERKSAEASIKSLAFYDQLTNVYNGMSFDIDLKRSLSKRERHKCISVLMLDIDGFSQINLAHGSSVGDEVLNSTSSRIDEVVSNIGKVYRDSQDTFYIIVEFQDVAAEKLTDTIYGLCQVLLHKFSYPIDASSASIDVRVTLSAIHLDDDIAEVGDVVRLLELAISMGKKEDGNTFKVVGNEEKRSLKRKSNLSLEMNKPGFLEQLSVVFQPQYSSKTGQIESSEVLVRWCSPSLGNVSPGEFIPLAETNGKIIDIGNYVFDSAFKILSDANKVNAGNYQVSINVSAKQIAQPLFESKILKQMEIHNLTAHSVTLEITESMLIQNFDLVINKMKFLAAKGFRFSLDDFGTGYSSLNYIRHLPIHELKIDKSFIDDVQSEFEDVAIVNTIIQMAESLQLKVVAEGVEEEIQARYLGARNCDLLQGYYFSKPLVVDDWLKVILTPAQSSLMTAN